MRETALVDWRAASAGLAAIGTRSNHIINARRSPWTVAFDVPGRYWRRALSSARYLRGVGTFVFNGTADGVVTSEPEAPQAFLTAAAAKGPSLFTAARTASSEFGFRPGGRRHSTSSIAARGVVQLDRHYCISPTGPARRSPRYLKRTSATGRHDMSTSGMPTRPKSVRAGVAPLGSGIPGTSRDAHAAPSRARPGRFIL